MAVLQPFPQPNPHVLASENASTRPAMLVAWRTNRHASLITSGGCQWAASGQNATGARLYEQGQYSAALQQFQKVITTDPTNADGYYNLAATNHRLGNQRRDSQQLDQAEALYNQCLDHDPNHVECHRGLAVLLVDTGRPDRAFALMKNWAAQNPNFAEPRIELARMYEEANDPQTALKYLEDAVQKDANNARVLGSLWADFASNRVTLNKPFRTTSEAWRSTAFSRWRLNAWHP